MSDGNNQKKTVFDAIRDVRQDIGGDLPFYIGDFSDVVYKYRYWKHKLPKIEPFYAVKCNSDPLLLKLMVALGVHFDCASKGEIEAALYAGAQPSDIIYAHPYKSKSFLSYACNVNVDLMTFDSEQELLKIKSVYPEARLVLRLRIPNVPAGFPLSKKFGCDANESRQLLLLARKLGMNVVGTSFHVGSLCEQPSAYAKAIRMSRDVFDEAESLGFHFTILDIGGGFPGATGTYDIFDEMCYFINRGLKEHFSNHNDVKVIAEPGCYMVCSAYTLCTKIIGKRMVNDSLNDNEDNCKTNPECYYYMNDSIYGSFAFGFEKYGFRVKPLVGKAELRQRPVFRSKMWGSTCCSSDCIMEDCLLPEMEVDEYIVFDNMGAYTQCLTTNFNGFPKPTSRYIFPPQPTNKPHKLPPYEDFLRELGSLQMKAFIKIQDYVCRDDSNVDLYRKG